MLQSRPFAVPVAGARAAQPVRLAPAAAKAPKAEAAPPSDERLRLNNLSPIPGSRMKKKRKGRGYAAGQVCLLMAHVCRLLTACLHGAVAILNHCQVQDGCTAAKRSGLSLISS